MTHLTLPAVFYSAVCGKVARMGGHASDMPGLWNIPGYPELTSGQVLCLPEQQLTPM